MKLKLIILAALSTLFLYFSFGSLSKKEQEVSIENFIQQYTDKTIDEYEPQIKEIQKKMVEVLGLEGTAWEPKEPALEEKAKNLLNKKPVAISSLTILILSLFLLFTMGKGKYCHSCRKHTYNGKKFCTHCGESLK